MLFKKSDHLKMAQFYAVAFAFILLMVAAAIIFQDAEIILPEIAAMAVALWVWRGKGWMRQPEKIFILPSVTALIGFGINLIEISYISKIIIVLVLMLIVMQLLQYSLAPALATGLLPIVTNATHFSFLAAIFVTTFMLMLGVYLFKLNEGVSREAPLKHKYMLIYLLLHLVWIGIVVLAGYPQMAIIPPVTVVVYETLHMPMYMRKMALKQIAVLTLSAVIGTVLFMALDNWLLIVALDMALIYGLLCLFQARIPAAYAFLLLPFVFPAQFLPQLPYAAAVVSVFFFSVVLAYKTYEKQQNMKLQQQAAE